MVESGGKCAQGVVKLVSIDRALLQMAYASSGIESGAAVQDPLVIE
jgi:hypothetical protein